MVIGIKPISATSAFIPAISVERQFRTDKTHYTRGADAEIWFMEDFQNVSLTDFWVWHGVKCVPIDGSAEFYICREQQQWYRPRGVNRFFSISADAFPVGVYDLYPVFKTDTTEWIPCYQDYARQGDGVRFEVTEDAISTSTSSVEEIRVDDAKNVVYYDLFGNKVSHPQKGIFIKISNGKAIKIRI